MCDENLISSPENEKKSNKIKIGDVIFYAVLFVVFIFMVFTTTFWFSTVKIQQTSMFPTLQSNDVVLLDKLSSYSRGDVIVFTHNENEDFIKRVIAVEGDTIYSIDGEVYVEYYSGQELVTLKVNEYYLNEQKSTYLEYNFGVGIIDIPRTTISSGCVYVLGDNRIVSVDSRDIGEISKDKVKGVVHEFWIKNKGVTTSIFSFFENIFTSCKG